MKILALAGCALLAAASLAACAPMATVTGGPASTVGLPAADQIALLKEANRHLETCDRTYAWPFAVTIHCAPVAGQPATTTTQGLTVSDVAAMIDAAVAKALAAKPGPPITN